MAQSGRAANANLREPPYHKRKKSFISDKIFEREVTEATEGREHRDLRFVICDPFRICEEKSAIGDRSGVPSPIQSKRRLETNGDLTEQLSLPPLSLFPPVQKPTGEGRGAAS